MKQALSVLIAVAGIQFAVHVASAADPPGFQTLAIGDAAPDFKLPGVDDKEYTLASFADAKLLVVIFTCNHCPTAQAYEQRIIQLHGLLTLQYLSRSATLK